MKPLRRSDSRHGHSENSSAVLLGNNSLAAIQSLTMPKTFRLTTSALPTLCALLVVVGVQRRYS